MGTLGTYRRWTSVTKWTPCWLTGQGKERAHKGLKRLTTIRKKTGHTWHFNQTPACDLKQVMIQVSMQTGHKLDKQDMVPDARKIMRTWYGTFMGLMEHKLNRQVVVFPKKCHKLWHKFHGTKLKTCP